jgi:uncharacterized protein
MNLLLYLIVLIIFIYSLIEPYLIEEKTIVVTDPDLPQEFNDTRIAFLSDIHHGLFLNRKRLHRLVRRINQLKPDLILLGGDYIHVSPKYIKPCFEELSHLKAPLGIFGVLGNHDHMEDPRLSRQAMSDAGIVGLDNKSRWIFKSNSKILISGVGDFKYDTQDIHSATGDARFSDFIILLTHNPDYAEIMKTSKINLVLAGHTHGGQVTLFGLWAPYIPSHYGQKYRTGLVQLDNTKVVISNGIGTSMLPIRFCARPQILTVVLKHAEQPS